MALTNQDTNNADIVLKLRARIRRAEAELRELEMTYRDLPRLLGPDKWESVCDLLRLNVNHREVK